MKLIVDNCEFGSFAARTLASGLPTRVQAIVVSPHAFAEIISFAPNRAKLEELGDTPFICGMDPGEAMERISTLTRKAVTRFAPFGRKITARQLASTIDEKQLQRAGEIKSRGREFCSWMIDQSHSARAELGRLEGGRITRHLDPVPVLQGMCQPKRVSWLIQGNVSFCGQREVSIPDPTRLSRACMANQFLFRMHAMQVMYMLSVTGIWTNQKLWLQKKRDDWTDVLLPLYADDGDVILSGDRWFTHAFRGVEATRQKALRAHVMTVGHFFGERTGHGGRPGSLVA